MYRQTILGRMIFTVVFGGVAGLPTDGLPGFMFYMAGSILWHYFASCLTSTSKTFVENRNLFGKVYFPRLCMPMRTVCSELINFFVQLAPLFLIFLIFYACRPNPAVVQGFRLLTPLMGLLGLGFGVIVAALRTPNTADLGHAGAPSVTWMYATPVTYSSSMMATFLGLYMLNPITPIIELFRAAFLGGLLAERQRPVHGRDAAVMGVVLFSHTEKTFMDTV